MNRRKWNREFSYKVFLFLPFSMLSPLLFIQKNMLLSFLSSPYRSVALLNKKFINLSFSFSGIFGTIGSALGYAAGAVVDSVKGVAKTASAAAHIVSGGRIGSREAPAVPPNPVFVHFTFLGIISFVSTLLWFML